MKNMFKHFLLTAVLVLPCIQASAHAPIIGITTMSNDGLISAESCPFLAVKYKKVLYKNSQGKENLENKKDAVFPFQFSIAPNINEYMQLCSGKTWTFLSLGLLALQQEGAAVSFAPAINGVIHNYGLQTAGLLATTEQNYFCQAGLINVALEQNYFLQAGLFNVTGRNGFLQAGLINAATTIKQDEQNWWNGIQIGFCNMLWDDLKGVGGNENEDFSLQIGLLNFNKHALLKWFPIINFSIPGLPRNGISRLPEIDFTGKTKQEVLEIIAKETKEPDGEIHLLMPFTRIEEHYTVFKNLDEALKSQRVQKANFMGVLSTRRLFSGDIYDFYELNFGKDDRVSKQEIRSRKKREYDK